MKKVIPILVALLLLCGILYLDKPSKSLTSKEQKQMASQIPYLYQNLPSVINTALPLSTNLQPIDQLAPIDTGGSGVTQGVNDAATLASFDQGISNTQSAINRLPASLQSGNGAIDTSFQNALNQLLLGKNQANSAYDTSKQQTAKDYVGAKNTIGANAGNSLNGLLRLLGSRGAGGGSAATVTAPGAVARQATLQRTDVGNTFGANNQALDTNWNNYLTGYGNEVSSATNQRDTQKSDLQRQIDTNKATLLQTLAQLTGQRAAAAGGNAAGAAQPYLNQANAILDQTSHYSTAPITYKTEAYTAPNLGQYTFNSATPTVQGQKASTDYVSPYLAALLGKKQLAGA